MISIDNQWTGTFTIDSTVGTNTTIVLRSPTEGLFTITLTKPDGEQLFLNNEPEVTNWNIHESNISVTWKRIPGLTESLKLLIHFLQNAIDLILEFFNHRLLDDGITL